MRANFAILLARLLQRESIRTVMLVQVLLFWGDFAAHQILALTKDFHCNIL